MKNYKLFAFLVAVLLVGTLSAQQSDDLYFNPARDKVATEKSSKTYKEKDYYYEDERSYDDESYDNADNYDYYYSSRIRRFQRPMYGFNFYDPFYVDMSYYDPFLSPASTMLIYDNPYMYNSWNNWNYGYGLYSPWGFNSYVGLGLSPWYGGWNSLRSYGYGYGLGNPYNYGYYGGMYCPPTWGSGYVYNTVENLRNTYYGPRTSGSARIPGASDGIIRREGPKDVTNTPREGISIFPRDRSVSTTPNDGVTTREDTRNRANTRAAAQEQRRREMQRNSEGVNSRNYNPSDNSSRTRQNTDAPRRNYDMPQQTRTREYQPPRTYEPPRQNFPDRSGWDNGSSRSGDINRGNNSSGSSAPRSSGSSRRGGNQ